MRPVLTLLIALGCLTGCMSSGPVPTVYYRLAPTADVALQPPVEGGPRIAVRPLRATSPRATGITYVEADRSEHVYPHVAWSEAPEDTLTRGLVATLVSLGQYSDAGIAGDTEIPDLIVQGEILAFHEERRADGSVAVCALNLEIRERTTERLALYETFTHEEPFTSGSVPGLAEALETAAASVLAEAGAAIGSNSGK